MTPVEFRGHLWHQKTRVPELSSGVICVILRLAVLVEHLLVSDRQTDGRTDTGPWLARGKNLRRKGSKFDHRPERPKVLLRH